MMMEQISVPSIRRTTDTMRVKPRDVSLQAEGFLWRDVLVRLPADVTLVDLQGNREIWRTVQATRNVALQRFDRVTCVAPDEAWIVRDAIVTHADERGATLAFDVGDVIRLPREVLA